MVKRTRRILALSLALPLLGGAAYWAWCRMVPATAAAGEKTTYYCPMHPDMKSDRPGNCPICSMKLVPLEASPPRGGAAGATGAPAAAVAAPGGAPTVRITPERQQQIGIKFAAAVRQPATVEIRAVGKVTADERRIARVHTKVAGWIEEVFVNFVGQPVRKGESLFTLYSPDLVSGQEEYLLALKARRQLGDSSFSRAAEGANAVAAAARRRLELWDVTAARIGELERTGRVTRTVAIHSPVSGVVTERAAYHHGLTVTPDMNLYTIADLNRVWVLAEVYESDLGFVRMGDRAEIELPYDAGKRVLSGKVAFIPPFLNPQTRTGQVRFEFANPGLALKLDSFVNVRLMRDLGSRLVGPKDAVMDTGKGQYVFVDRGDGYLEPRPVKAGAEVTQGRVVEEGLGEGERVVTAANFVLDSESRLRGAFEAMGKPAPAQTAAVANQARIDVTTSPSPAKVGKNAVRVAASDAQGQPIEGAEVEVRIFMPQMGAMAPMEAKARLAEKGGGRYEGEIEIPMAWSWEATVTVRKGGQTVANAVATITAR